MINKTQAQVMENWSIEKNTIPIISIKCLTFNQEDFIAQTLDGFLSQETNFPFEAIVHDDASSDKTAEIIRKYEKKFPQIIKAIYETENQYSKHDNSIARIVVPKLRGKYIAMCEGDDYWTDPHKLQRQVDFLESHPEYSLSTENGTVLITKTGECLPFSTEPEHDISQDELLIRRRFPTASVVYRGEYINELYKIPGHRVDTTLWAYLATKGKIHYNPMISSVYRRGCGVTEANKIKWAYTCEAINQTIIQNFHPNAMVLKERKKTFLNDLVAGYKAAARKGDTKNRIKLFLKILKYSPLTVLKIPIQRRVEKIKHKFKDYIIPFYYKYFPAKNGIDKSSTETPIIISLTSYPARFATLHLCIKSLLNQTQKPSMIVLYLDKNISREQIPIQVLSLEKYGLTIKNICNDLKPHKKYFYAMQEFPDAAIITADDDLIYPKDLVLSLVKSFRNFPKAISARRVHKIARNLNKEALPYNFWNFEYKNLRNPTLDLCATSGAGTLYPPKIFDTSKNYFREENIRKYCLHADDIWLKFIELQENVPIVWVPCKNPMPFEIPDKRISETALQNQNVFQCKNDEAIRNCEEFFGIKL